MTADYKYIYVTNKRGKTDVEHRVIMEEHLGRELDYNEVVHHINGDDKDNRLENLQLMSRSEHTKLHNPKISYTCFICNWCGKIIFRKPHQYKTFLKTERKLSFCSKKCAGLYNYHILKNTSPAFKGKK